MPFVGLGTFKIKGQETVYSAIDAALAAGYRSFDTASVYKNETDIGSSLNELLPKYNLSRKDLFITSKLGPSEQGAEKAPQAIQGSLARLDCGYLDLYLIHWPGTHKLKVNDVKHKQMRRESWEAMEHAHKQGLIQSLGVSNYLEHHLEELLGHCTVRPAVLQIEYHPHLVQRSMKKFCDNQGIHLQAYSSLGTSTEENKLLSEPTISQVAQQCGVSPAQVLLRWAVQQGVGVLPKSTNPSHISQNVDVFTFDLTDHQMTLISDLDKQTKFCWDPSLIA